jgi:1,4-alpha-glucan branching enzyme
MSFYFSDVYFTEQIQQLKNCTHTNPHMVLGLHSLNNKKYIRLWRPGASYTAIELFGKIVELEQLDHSGFFEHTVPNDTQPTHYRVYNNEGELIQDPYTFLPTFGETDQYLFAQGVHYEIHKKMGGRLTTHQGISGASFTVWAPNARSVSVVGDFNHWDGRAHPLRVLGHSGVWEIFIPGVKEGVKYKFEIRTQQGELLLKSDPYAYSGELRPATASQLVSLTHFQWGDQDWIKNRTKISAISKPMNIYEVHLGSWRHQSGNFLNYREAAHQLTDYCHEMGFTHIELLPIQEHPLDESWGYQSTGFYAPSSRFGSLQDFQYFVDYLHRHQLGLLLDWVPGHFPVDDFSLGKFDGSSLYEHADPKQGFHPHWFTHIFNFGRREVTNFLLGSALFWLESMHIDGFRVDAVASILYLDYGREYGEWIPNMYGGNANLEAIEFLKHFNSIVHQRHPGILTIAEESTSFPGMTHPLEIGGLGFDLKWNMGWMNDTLRYFSKDTAYRSHHQNDLTFGLIYAFSEKFVLVLSHDEVVHGKKNLISKMPGDWWQQFANLRLLLSYMMCQPGKKLLFMGCELAQWSEWNAKRELDWYLLDQPMHRGLHTMVKELNHLYLNHTSLWERDFSYTTFEWVDFADQNNSVISYLRKSESETLLCIHNFTPIYHPEYIIHCEGVKSATEIFNSDASKYGGSDKRSINPVVVKPYYESSTQKMIISLAPLATQIFKLERGC